MKKTKQTTEEFSNIVTPPDFVKSGPHTVVIIDPEWTEIEDVAFYLKTAKEAYTVYVYRTADMNDDLWLKKAISKSTHIIVNSINNDSSKVKDKLATTSKAYHYGPKQFLSAQDHRIEKPIDYFINLEK